MRKSKHIARSIQRAVAAKLVDDGIESENGAEQSRVEKNDDVEIAGYGAKEKKRRIDMNCLHSKKQRRMTLCYAV